MNLEKAKELKDVPFQIYIDSMIYERGGVQVPITIDFRHSPHAIICGESGSGKTYAAKLLLGSIRKFVPNAELYVCDYKNDDDFYYLTGNERYWGGDDCEQGLETFYERFESRRKREELDRHHIFLFFDEYQSFLETFEGDSKTKKRGDELKSKFGKIMRMGRSLGVHIICALQNAHANYFPYGARESFKIRLGLGELSPQSRTMLFNDYTEKIKDDEHVNGQGRGYMLIKGKLDVLKNVRVPRFNIEKVNREIELFVQEGVVHSE